VYEYASIEIRRKERKDRKEVIDRENKDYQECLIEHPETREKLKFFSLWLIMSLLRP
jgi:hypothetical protein